MKHLAIVLCAFITLCTLCNAYVVGQINAPQISWDRSNVVPVRSSTTRLRASNRSGGPAKDGEKLGGSVTTRGIFALAEAFGSLTSLGKKESTADNLNPVLTNQFTKVKKVSLDAIGIKIRNEYERIFWATGNMDTSLWKDDCVFADPFSSFGGDGATQRFKQNAENLGKFVVDPVMKVSSYVVNREEFIVKVGWVYSSKLKLPWNPVLAAAGVTVHYIDPQDGLIYKYEEQWKSKPWEVVKRLFVPT